MKNKILCVILSFVIILSTCLPSAAAKEQVFGLDEYIQAESATLYIATVVEDKTALGGKYINLNGNGRLDDTGLISTPEATYKINVPEDGTYTMWYRAWCPSAANNSFWFRWDNGDWSNCSPTVSTTWAVGKIGTAVELKKGEHTFSVYHRENGSRIDFFYLTYEGAAPQNDLADIEEGSFTINEYIEAESGKLDSVVVLESKDVMGGKYVKLIGSGRFDDTSSITTPQAMYKINVPKDGDYTMWYRAWCSNDGSDSFWYRWDDGEWTVTSPVVDTTWLPGNIATISLAKGTHTFSINRREPDTRLDFFYLAPSDVTPPVDLIFNDDGSYTVNENMVVDGDYKDIIEDGFETGTVENFTARRTSEVGSIEEFEARLAQGVYPGDEILFKDGVYTGKLIAIEGISGSAKYPVRIAAKNPGGAIFEGNVAVRLDNCKYVEFGGFYFKDVLYHAPGVEAKWVEGTLLALTGCTNCRVTNNYVENCGDATGEKAHMFRIHGGSSYNRMDHNTFDNPYSMQIGVVATSVGVNSRNRFNRVDHNHFVNVQSVKTLHPSSDGNGMESVQLASGINTAKPNSIVEYNLFENVTGDGGEIISSKSDNNVIQYNTFYDCSSGPTLRFADGNIVRGNYFCNTNLGLRVYGKNHLISGNYFENLSRNAIDIRRGKNGAAIYKRSENIIVEDNVIVKARGKGISVDLAETADSFYARNIQINSNVILAGPTSQPFYEVEENENITYKDNRVLALSGVANTVYSEGIDYVDSLEKLALPELPKRLTNEDAGTTWKKGVNTNATYVEKRDKIIAFAPGKSNAYNCG